MSFANYIQLILSELNPFEKANVFEKNYRRYMEIFNTIHQSISLEQPIIDIGSGPGHVALLLHKLGYDITVADVDFSEYHERYEKFNIGMIKTDIEFEDLPLNANSFECVIFTEVIEHLSYYHIDHVLAQIHRILKENGKLIITTPNFAAIELRLSLLFGGIQPFRVINVSHNRIYTMKEIETFLQRNNFKIIHKYFSLSKDVVTKVDSARYSKEHVVKNFLKYRNKVNIGRALFYPLKYIIPSFRSKLFILAEKKAP
jgi:2-polyprenyl-3-methyl-5-hydroxy-6-metoxy-1,4-benzoquinol methylase